MIAALTLLYVGLLFLAVKLKLIKMTLFWKITPLVWFLFLNVALIIPMQFYAPGGTVLAMQYSVQIVPNVGGEVIDVPVEANAPLREGDVLFRIDPTPYQAAVDDLTAQRDLAQIRVDQTTQLVERGAGTVFELDTATAQLAQLEAGLANARFNLENTVVRAPTNGYVTNVALREGARVAAAPIASVLPFVEDGDPVIIMQIFQKDLRYIDAGNAAEITFKMFPGEVFQAKVLNVVPASAQGLQAPTGTAAMPQQISHAPMWVRLEMADPSLFAELPVGATGTGAIYTDKGAPTQMIRRIMIRMDAIINYVSPA
ncbi:efflux RND transporter periplasmic adaptor subunit [Congregibacter sp.]|uniref:efflux RND transporter periplasmic adaptor subunit n=1 Tax=Congregibacter sp. TaxID=2744308 RepID=UPI003F6A9C71